MHLTTAVITSATSVVAGRDGVLPGLRRPTWIPPAQARRFDPLTGLVCACVDQLPGFEALPSGTAVVVGTAWGNVESTLRFADGMRAYGDAGSGPTTFTTSVHHNPAGILGELRGWHGPASTISLGGLSGLTALRQALLLTAARHLPTMMIAADLPNPLVAGMIAESTKCRWPIGSGATALLICPEGAGWQVESDPVESLPAYDAGGATAGDERILAAGPQRFAATGILGYWYPGAGLAIAPWQGTDPFAICERDSGVTLRLGFRRA